MDTRTCVSDLARYTEFLREEEECLVEHVKSLTAVVAMAHAASEARNREIYKENHRFERGHLERQRVFEVSVIEAATVVAQLSRRLLLLHLLLSALGRGEVAESSTKPLPSSSSI